MSIVIDTLRQQYTRTFVQVRGAAKLVAYHHQKATDEEARLHDLTNDLAELELAITLGGGELPRPPVDDTSSLDDVNGRLA